MNSRPTISMSGRSVNGSSEQSSNIYALEPRPSDKKGKIYDEYGID